MSVAIYLVSRPSLDGGALSCFLADVGAKWGIPLGVSEAEQIVELGGRVCRLSFGRESSEQRNVEYIRRLLARGHDSVLEHVNWGFLIRGVSRAFTHQLVRHRVGFAFSQLSQQYHDQTASRFVEPSVVARDPDVRAAWQRAVEASKAAYREILGELRRFEKQTEESVTSQEKDRAIRSAARSVLPNATETTLLVTANARALRHFLSIRGSIPGDEEMREVAAELLKLLRQEAPGLFQDFYLDNMPDGSPIVLQKELRDVDD